jgi:hypothetical protein
LALSLFLMDIAKLIERQKLDLTRKLELLNGNDLNQLFAEKKGYQEKVSELESKIEHICGELGIDLGTSEAASKPAKKERARRMGGDEIKNRILDVLKGQPNGLSQKEISDLSGVGYPSVINFIKDNAEILNSVGERKSKRIFLK